MGLNYSYRKHAMMGRPLNIGVTCLKCIQTVLYKHVRSFCVKQLSFTVLTVE